MVEAVEDPRVDDDICGVTKIGATGVEWICIRTPHDAVYMRKSSSGRNRRGQSVYSSNPSVEQHYFINRWPNRGKS